MRTLRSALVLAATLMSVVPIAAQSTQPEPGQRVTLVLAPRQSVQGYAGREVRGTLTAADADSLTVEVSPGTPVRVARGAVRETYVSLGVPSRGKSAAIGAAGGLVTGLTTSLTWNKDERHSTSENALIGSVGGAIGGALAGALIRRERWELVRPPRNVSLAPAVLPDAQGLMVSIRL
jgi:hypothetical protein